MTAAVQRNKSARRRTAYHEAGHAVACYYLLIRFKYVTIRPNKENLGHLRRWKMRLSGEQLYDPSLCVRDRLERRIVMTLAGAEAERLVSRRRNLVGQGLSRLVRDARLIYVLTPSGDMKAAIEMASTIARGADEACSAYLHWLRVRAEELVHVRRPEIDAVAAALLERERLTEADVRQVINNRALGLGGSTK